MHNPDVGKKSSDLGFLTGLNEEQVLDIFEGHLCDLDKAAISRVVKSRQEGLLVQIREESYRLEREEAEKHLHRWINTHWNDSSMKRLLRADSTLRSEITISAKSELAGRIVKHKRSIFLRIFRKKRWFEELSFLERELALLDDHLDQEEFVRLCQEIDGQWRLGAKEEGIANGHIVLPSSYQSTLDWCEEVLKNQNGRGV